MKPRILSTVILICGTSIFASSQSIYFKGSKIGEIESDGDVYVGSSKVGEIESDGDVYYQGSKIGDGSGIKREWLAAFFFFFFWKLD